MSEFSCDVVQVKMSKHPKADTLSIVKVYDYDVVVKTSEFEGVSQAVYLPVDSIIPENMRSQFAHLKSGSRVRAVKLRGIFSEGLLIPDKSEKYDLGSDVAPVLGVTKYEQPLSGGGHQGYKSGKLVKEEPWFKKYTGIENIKKYKSALEPEEVVVATEKIHGTNARFGFHKGKFIVGSHNTQKFYAYGWKHFLGMFIAKVLAKFGYKKLLGSYHENNKSWWCNAADQHDLRKKLSKHPGYIVYGEIFGSGVQDLTYGVPTGTLAFKVFDIFDIENNLFLNYWDMVTLTKHMGLENVPHLWDGYWKDCDLQKHTEGKSTLDDKQIREGCVVKPIVERLDSKLGRVILKSISPAYRLRDEGTEFK